jgi:hypothetical protein
MLTLAMASMTPSPAAVWPRPCAGCNSYRPGDGPRRRS